MFSTHPDTGNRIAALHAMADELGLASPPPALGRGAPPRSSVPKTRRSASALDPLGRGD
jgi:heat shock protein HtpX